MPAVVRKSPYTARRDGDSVRICLKIDVDTLQGYLVGVPRMAAVLGRLGVRATFCVAVGPDRSGRAIRRLFTRRGFLRKMLRTRAPSTYTWRTLLYGTLLPAPLIAAGTPRILKDLRAAGHEVIPHGWDHVSWHDFLRRWDANRTRRELDLACDTLERHLGEPCQAFASPGWQATDASLLAEEQRGLLYAADVRGWAPFFPLVGRRATSVLQLPTSLPTLDEMIGRPDLRDVDLLEYLLAAMREPARPARQVKAASDSAPSFAAPADSAHVFTAHAEIEGGTWASFFEQLVSGMLAAGARFLTLGELAAAVRRERTALTGGVVDVELPGRAGTVACQAGFV